MKFEIFKDRRGEFRFRGVARNGKIVCASEGYKTKRSMLKDPTQVHSINDHLLSPIVEGNPALFAFPES